MQSMHNQLFVFRRLVGSFYVATVSEETASICGVEVGYI